MTQAVPDQQPPLAQEQKPPDWSDQWLAHDGGTNPMPVKSFSALGGFGADRQKCSPIQNLEHDIDQVAWRMSRSAAGCIQALTETGLMRSISFVLRGGRLLAFI